MYPQRSVMTCGLATALEPPYFNHAPVWGATCPLRLWNMARTCFNPRTRVGCDTSVPRSRFRQDGFNPRTRVGCDMAPHAGHGLPALVSIHAPAWGATPCPDVPERAVRRFNPRTRVGCDVLAATPMPRDARVSIHAPAWGATRRCHLWPLGPPVSIHAPAWGATSKWWS